MDQRTVINAPVDTYAQDYRNYHTAHYHASISL